MSDVRVRGLVRSREARSRGDSPDNPRSRQRGRSFGAIFAFDLWKEPTSSIIIAANALLSSIETIFSARLAFGWHLLNAYYAGPEVQVCGCGGYRQLLFRAHVTSWKIGGSEWSAPGGWSIDSEHHGSPYVRRDIMLRL